MKETGANCGGGEEEEEGEDNDDDDDNKDGNKEQGRQECGATVPALGPSGEGQEARILRPPLYDPVPPPPGGGALSSSKGGGVRVSIARPLTPSSLSPTANDDNENDYDEHKGKHDGNECKDSCLGILHIVWNRGTPVASCGCPRRLMQYSGYAHGSGATSGTPSGHLRCH